MTSERHRIMKGTRDPEWFAHVREGDVLRRGRHGAMRIVRHVSRYSNGQLWGVTFAIQRRSWTNRAYTIYLGTDLKQFGYEYVGARVKLTSELDAKLHTAINGDEDPPHFTLTARDVIGIP